MREIYLWIIGSYVSSSSLTHPLFSSVVFHSSFPTSLSVSLLLVYFRSVWGLTSVGCLTCLSHLVICLHPFATSCFFYISYVSYLLFSSPSWLTALLLPLFRLSHMYRGILNDGTNPSLTLRTYALPLLSYESLPVLPLVPQPAEICPLR